MPDEPRVSVVICTHTIERFGCFSQAVQSALTQTHENTEVVIVVDGDGTVADCAKRAWGDAVATIHVNETALGISTARTQGARLATGDIVAFLDDDATARETWAEELVAHHQEVDDLAVGGPVEPDWMVDRPDFLPREFYWLVGCTERDFAADGDRVRNTYGSNISFDREAFLEIGGYDARTGRRKDSQIQAHEAPACIRLNEQYGSRVFYTDDAVVDHKLFEYRTKPRWLLKRAFWQGYSKYVMGKYYPDGGGDEKAFLKNLLTKWVPGRVRKLIRRPSRVKATQLMMLFLLTAAVGFGFVFGHVLGLVPGRGSGHSVGQQTGMTDGGERDGE